MAQQYGVEDKGMVVFRRVVGEFDKMLGRYRMLLEQGAHEIEDPLESAKRLQWIGEQIARIQKTPYLPFMRFGNYTLTVRDGAGTVSISKLLRARELEMAHMKKRGGHFPAMI